MILPQKIHDRVELFFSGHAIMDYFININNNRPWWYHTNKFNIYGGTICDYYTF